MPVYVCRKDGYDLAAEVERALADEGGDVLNIDDVLVEGLPEESGFSERTVLDADMARARDDVVKVVVTCPKDDAVNVFLVARR